MKWERIGPIFDPTKLCKSDPQFEFAKSPQAIVYDDFVRIYFSGQTKGSDGKYLSFPYYIETDRQLSKILKGPVGPVMQLGALGCFDEHGIFPFHVMRDSNHLYAFTTGWSRRCSVSIDMAIGLASSSDGGQSFHRYGAGGPVMTAEFGEACLVGDAFVRKIGDEFRMWYIFGPPWKRGGNGTAERFYRIASARSRDMIKWERNSNYLIEPTIENECQALPTVLQTKDGFHMYFCFRSAFDFRTDVKHSYRLGYAYSQDGEVWVRDDASGGMTLIDTGWDSQMMCYPNLFDVDGQIYLLYNGNEFGRYGFGLAKLISSSR